MRGEGATLRCAPLAGAVCGGDFFGVCVFRLLVFPGSCPLPLVRLRGGVEGALPGSPGLLPPRGRSIAPAGPALGRRPLRIPPLPSVFRTGTVARCLGCRVFQVELLCRTGWGLLRSAGASGRLKPSKVFLFHPASVFLNNK